MFMNNSPLSDIFHNYPSPIWPKEKAGCNPPGKHKQNKKTRGEKDIQSTLSVLKKWISLIQSPSHVQLFATPWTAACQASITNSWSLLKLMSIESVMPSNHLILLSIFPSIRVFSNVSVLSIRWPQYWSFSFSISLSNEYSRLISFKIDWFDLLAVQGTLKSLLQHHSSIALILRCSAFFIVQLSHPYMTPGKTIALTRWTFVSKVMPLLFNILSMLVIAFLPKKVKTSSHYSNKCFCDTCGHQFSDFSKIESWAKYC